jgi:hypothetical protein
MPHGSQESVRKSGGQAAIAQSPANAARRAKGSDVTREKLKVLLEEYGRMAVWIYLVIWLVVLAGFATAISAGFNAGFNVKSVSASGMGVLGAAWLATKLTQPLRIAATLLLTPAISTALKKWRGRNKSQGQNTTS